MFQSNKKYVIYILDIITSILGFAIIILLLVNVKKETPYLITTPTPTIGYKLTTYRLIKELQSIIYVTIFMISFLLMIYAYISKKLLILLNSTIVLISAMIITFIIASYGINNTYLTKYSYAILVLGVINILIAFVCFTIKFILVRRLY